MVKKESSSTSPNWSNSTKIIITLLMVACVVALMIRFSSLFTTLITALIIAILFHPVANWIHRKLKIAWTWSVTIVYIFAMLILFGLITLGGIAVIDQVDGLIKFLQNSLYDIPNLLNQLTTTVLYIGPFKLDFTYIDWNSISNQLLSTIEPVLSNLGNIIGGIASGTAGFIGSLLLALVISFLLLNESGGARKRILAFEVPTYQEDFAILGAKINTIWNAFLRGQAIVFSVRFIMYLIILSIFRVRFLFGMALIATIGNFIPYIGVAISWITIFFVALLQGSTVFALQPLSYALIVMGSGWISDNLYDTFFSPRFMANVLEVHPAAILVGVFVGLNLFGFWGMILAAPAIATLKMIFNYVEKKLLDQDPWEEPSSEEESESENLPVLGKALKSVSGWTKEKIDKYISKNKD